MDEVILYTLYIQGVLFYFCIKKQCNSKQRWLLWRIFKQVLTNYLFVLLTNFYIIIIFKTYRVTPHSFTHAHYIVLNEHTSIFFSINKQIPIYHSFPFVLIMLVIIVEFVKKKLLKIAMDNCNGIRYLYI